MTEVSYEAARAALHVVLPRYSRLLREVADRGAPAIGTWRVADVAAHVSHVIRSDTNVLARRTLDPVEVSPGGLDAWTASMLSGDGERDLSRLADRIDDLAEQFLALRPPDGDVAWVGRVELSPAAVACHLLEELLVHGHDTASASGRPWSIEPAHAALSILGAGVPLMAAVPALWVDPARDPSRHVRVEFRLRGQGRFVMELTDTLRVELPPRAAYADAYVSGDAATLLLIFFRRRPLWPAALRGKVVAWGRRPAAALHLLSTVAPP